MYLYILLLLFLLLFQASSSGPENFQEEHFTKNFELPLRGFFTLVIVFHHLSPVSYTHLIANQRHARLKAPEI